MACFLPFRDCGHEDLNSARCLPFSLGVLHKSTKVALVASATARAKATSMVFGALTMCQVASEWELVLDLGWAGQHMHVQPTTTRKVQ